MGKSHMGPEPVDWQTDTTKNITFSQIRWPAVEITDDPKPLSSVRANGESSVRSGGTGDKCLNCVEILNVTESRISIWINGNSCKIYLTFSFECSGGSRISQTECLPQSLVPTARKGNVFRSVCLFTGGGGLSASEWRVYLRRGVFLQRGEGICLQRGEGPAYRGVVCL